MPENHVENLAKKIEGDSIYLDNLNGEPVIFIDFDEQKFLTKFSINAIRKHDTETIGKLGYLMAEAITDAIMVLNGANSSDNDTAILKKGKQEITENYKNAADLTAAVRKELIKVLEDHFKRNKDPNLKKGDVEKFIQGLNSH